MNNVFLFVCPHVLSAIMSVIQLQTRSQLSTAVSATSEWYGFIVFVIVLAKPEKQSPTIQLLRQPLLGGVALATLGWCFAWVNGKPPSS